MNNQSYELNTEYRQRQMVRAEQERQAQAVANDKPKKSVNIVRVITQILTTVK